LFIDLNHADDI